VSLVKIHPVPTCLCFQQRKEKKTCTDTYIYIVDGGSYMHVRRSIQGDDVLEILINFEIIFMWWIIN